MDHTVSTIRYPQISGSRKCKGLTLKISKPILQLAKRMAEEKAGQCSTASSITSVPVVERKEDSAAQSPRRTLHWSKKISAMLAVRPDGFTLGNPVECVVWSGTCDNSHLATEVLAMNRRTLRTYDKRTYKMAKDVKKAYIEEFKRMNILKPELFDKNPCFYCKSQSCHIWHVASGLTYFFNTEFNAIPH